VFLGLLVLASEYAWAGRAVDRTRARAADATRRLHSTRAARLGALLSAAAMITGGAAVAALLDGHRYLGIGLLVGGAGGLALLIPATQRLLDPEHPPTVGESVTAEPGHRCTATQVDADCGTR
jgi:hypothetical protein